MSRIPEALERDLHRYADGELDAAAVERLEARIEALPEARQRLEQIRSIKAQLREALSEPALSSDTGALEQRIRQALRAETEGSADQAVLSSQGAVVPLERPTPSESIQSATSAAGASDGAGAGSGRRSGWLLAAAAVAAILLLTVWVLRPDGTTAPDARTAQARPVGERPSTPGPSAGDPAEDPGASSAADVAAPSIIVEVAADVIGLQQGRWSLVRAAEQGPELEAWFVAEGIDFTTRVLDLAMMEYRLEGGSTKTLQGMPSAAFAYLGPDGRLLCQMFPGDEASLPKGAEVMERDGIVFHSYTDAASGVAMTFWREGGVLCVLAASMPPQTVRDLAVAKAMKV